MAHSRSTGQRSHRGRSRLSSKDLSPPGSRQGVRGAYRGSGRLPEVSAYHRRRPSASACLWDLRASASPGLAPAVTPQLSQRGSSLGALPRATHQRRAGGSRAGERRQSELPRQSNQN
ncbi:hypothetical protein NDU88_006502 [Pleurodeles waltl]|uniref:Uncharacterized protein n=1 Tax=Pleurodeles waltl TaxID=8319 RepID=A0AAV7X1G6_PLEWA|nr:hypothetical protein NDU88_006502 [Pleurodeles waltl]